MCLEAKRHFHLPAWAVTPFTHADSAETPMNSATEAAVIDGQTYVSRQEVRIPKQACGHTFRRVEDKKRGNQDNKKYVICMMRQDIFGSSVLLLRTPGLIK